MALKLVSQTKHGLVHRLILFASKWNHHLISKLPLVKTVDDLNAVSKNNKKTNNRYHTHAQAIARQDLGQVLNVAGKRTERQSDFPL